MPKVFQIRGGGVVTGPITITITGPQASGKTSIARAIEELFMKKSIPVLVRNRHPRGFREQERHAKDREDYPIIIEDMQ